MDRDLVLPAVLLVATAIMAACMPSPSSPDAMKREAALFRSYDTYVVLGERLNDITLKDGTRCVWVAHRGGVDCDFKEGR